MANIELTDLAPTIQTRNAHSAELSVVVLIDGETHRVVYPLAPLDLAHLNQQAARAMVAMVKYGVKHVEYTEVELAGGFPLAKRIE